MTHNRREFEANWPISFGSPTRLRGLGLRGRKLTRRRRRRRIFRSSNSNKSTNSSSEPSTVRSGTLSVNWGSCSKPSWSPPPPRSSRLSTRTGNVGPTLCSLCKKSLCYQVPADKHVFLTSQQSPTSMNSINLAHNIQV